MVKKIFYKYVEFRKEITERYSKKEIESALKHNGFELIGMYSDFNFTPAVDTDERWYVVARAKKDWSDQSFLFVLFSNNCFEENIRKKDKKIKNAKKIKKC